MGVYRIADFNIKINNLYRYTTRICEKYKCDNENVDIDFEITPSSDDYDVYKEKLEGYQEAVLESISIYRQIARKLLNYNGLILHAAVVDVDGKAYAFSAPSGTGKSTHIKLWQEAFRDKVSIVNGDKPIIRIIDGKIYAYGTPWCGKEGLNTNMRSELTSICFISRGKENSIKEIDKKEALSYIFTQLLMPETTEQSQSFFDILDTAFSKVKFYKLACNMEINAAITAYEGMKNND